MSLLRLNWIKSTIRKSLDSCITEVPFLIPFGAFVAVFSSSIFPWISVYVVSHFFIFSVRRFFLPWCVITICDFFASLFFISCFTLYGPRKWLFPLHVLFFVVITRSFSLFEPFKSAFFKKAPMLFFRLFSGDTSVLSWRQTERVHFHKSILNGLLHCDVTATNGLS